MKNKYLTEKDIDCIVNAANNAMVKSKGQLRFGQSVWNASEDYIRRFKMENLSKKLEEIRGSDNDPFYNNANVTHFLDILQGK